MSESKRQPPSKPSLLAGLLGLRRGAWEAVATALIGVGVVMLMQPVAIEFFTYSFIVILTGTVMFIVVSHFRE